jgi:hypothetical protein
MSKGRHCSRLIVECRCSIEIIQYIRCKICLPKTCSSYRWSSGVSNVFVLDYVKRNQVPSDTSSSDSEAPISKGAVKLAVAAAASAAAAGAAGKLKVVHAPLCCTGTPKNDPLCTCDFCMLPPPPAYKKPSRK